jgi:hypothetical protein
VARTLTPGLSRALLGQSGYPGFLVKLTTNANVVYRWCSLDTEFTYDGHYWEPKDLAPSSLTWDGSIVRPAAIVFGDVDGAFWTMAKAGLLTDAKLKMWFSYQGAPNESTPIWAGYIGQIARSGAVQGQPTVSMELYDGSDLGSAPRTRIQEVVSAQWLIVGGTTLNFNGVVTILRSPSSGAG